MKCIWNIEHEFHIQYAIWYRQKSALSPIHTLSSIGSRLLRKSHHILHVHFISQTTHTIPIKFYMCIVYYILHKDIRTCR